VPFRSVRIEALASILPPERVASTTLEEGLQETYARIGVPMGTLDMLVGVNARRFWADPVDGGVVAIDALAADVVKKALSSRPELINRVGMCVSTSVCKDYIEPSVAALVAGSLEFSSECQTFDVGNACLGFLTGIELVARRIELREIDVAVVVAAESSRHVVGNTIKNLQRPTTTMEDFRQALPTLTLGSAAVAMVLVHESIATTHHRVNDVVTRSDPRSSRICLGTPDWMKTEAHLLLKNGVELAAQTGEAACARFGWSASSVDQFLCHQVGAKHLASVCKRLDLPLDKAFKTYPEFGNTGPAAVPMALALAVEDGVVKDGHRLALMGIGSGLNVSMMDVSW
jgi:3-oxoacyl-[acyl-carrier-protein] synthase-3